MTRQFGIPSRSEPAPTRGDLLAQQLLHEEAALHSRWLIRALVALLLWVTVLAAYGLLRIAGVIG